MCLVGYLYEDYHDARSLEHEVRRCTFVEQCWNDGGNGKRRLQNKHYWQCAYSVTL